VNRRVIAGGAAALALAVAVVALMQNRGTREISPSGPAKSAPQSGGQTRIEDSSPRAGAAAEQPPAKIRSAIPPPAERATIAEKAPNGANLMPGMKELASGLNDPAHSTEEDIEIVASLINQYRAIFGQNPPGGSNAEIVASLTGDNAKRLAIVPPDLPALNGEGELVDRWGTPFLFHPVSSLIMEILSAGPDQRLWTEDDVGSLTPVNEEMPPTNSAR
jgi:hypothetical protein